VGPFTIEQLHDLPMPYLKHPSSTNSSSNTLQDQHCKSAIQEYSTARLALRSHFAMAEQILDQSPAASRH